MKPKINAFFHITGAIGCEERCSFHENCANHINSRGHESVGGFSPELSIEGKEVFCETKERPVFIHEDLIDYSAFSLAEMFPENYKSLKKGMVIRDSDGVLYSCGDDFHEAMESSKKPNLLDQIQDRTREDTFFC